MGKTIFVEYFSIFKAYANGQLSKEKCIELLVSNEVSNEAGASIRCSNAKQIFEVGMERSALEIISESNRLPYSIINAAQNLLGS